MYNATSLWYSDKFSVYRNVLTEKMGVSKTERILVSKDNYGRIYRKSNASLNPTPQAAQLSISEALITDIDVDIQAGDELHVLRGFRINKHKNECDIYVAGQPVDYFTPYGGVAPDLQHKQVLLQNTLRTGAYIEQDV